MDNTSIQRNASEIQCRDDFILVLNRTRCNPRCDRFEQIPHHKRVLEDVLNLIGVGICTFSFTVLIIVSIIRWKKMCVPSNTCVFVGVNVYSGTMHACVYACTCNVVCICVRNFCACRCERERRAQFMITQHAILLLYMHHRLVFPAVFTILMSACPTIVGMTSHLASLYNR